MVDAPRSRLLSITAMSGKNDQRSDSRQSHQVELEGVPLLIERLWPEGWSALRWFGAVLLVTALVTGLAAFAVKVGCDAALVLTVIKIALLALAARLYLPAIAFLVIFHAPTLEPMRLRPISPLATLDSFGAWAIGWPVADLDRPPRNSANKGR
ncbi:hypothetical protein XhyaCFBP1156_20300 [Xanthomonas hyacinthi]|uniref:Uncharacterized protein n=2 Tax=Xanthomonas hyacinthi TaxID=56455 RepID=A0A2S7EP98_9XANT|nr:hypothetical protein XhyaCFBP1156_20300 [Xanthomonas hyacinthi]